MYERRTLLCRILSDLNVLGIYFFFQTFALSISYIIVGTVVAPHLQATLIDSVWVLSPCYIIGIYLITV